MPKKPTRKKTVPPRANRVRQAPHKSPPPPAPAAPSGAAAIETLKQQADRLGLLDPLDVEPSNIYSPDESDT
jgi:hypothetical protein